MDVTARGGREGRTGCDPVINEMLLHDVYELPRELLRGASRATTPATAPDETRTERIPPTFLTEGLLCRTPLSPPFQTSS